MNMNEKMNMLERINLVDFIDYCLTDSTMFFNFHYDGRNKNLHIRITNEIGACYEDEKLIEIEKKIQRDRTFRLSSVEKFGLDKYQKLACDSILDVGYKKNEIWFLLGEGETLRVDTKEGFEISTLSLASFKKELAMKKLVGKTQNNLLRRFLLISCLWFIACSSLWYFLGLEKAKSLFFSGCILLFFVATLMRLGRKIKGARNESEQ